MDRIYARLGFHDHEACLDEFRGKIRDEETLLKAAERITNPATQDVMLGIAYELSL
jgi:hypothetical protein